MQSKNFLLYLMFLGFLGVTLSPSFGEEPPYNPQPLPEYGEPPAKGRSAEDDEATPRKSQTIRPASPRRSPGKPRDPTTSRRVRQSYRPLNHQVNRHRKASKRPRHKKKHHKKKRHKFLWLF